ncbi:S41 family peptidase [Rhodohalobacter mucosus]|uniref:Tricorn protease homolog n=1 Tax=Rhodohalobacter mucosus TaxID=2079485 RepID=A0A316TVV3_9BACT|nr:S41 family peptidase [Rhodohalobacter mucosus]PWN08088.1 peptidase S41 [Rhodohalobacter mucosus]
MFRTLFSIFTASLFLFINMNPAAAQVDAPYFTSHPTLTPDGEHILFSYESDLWMVPSQGGQAVRLTAMDGIETRPEVSPDGQWVAFSSEQYGNMDVYIMPIEGGEIRQLTFHQAADEVEGWSWDSQTIHFTSSRENRFSTWQISLNGGTPARVFSHYHNTDHNAAAHPDGRIFFNTSWESKNQAHRKRYRGSFAPQIESWNPETGKYEVHTDFNGKDMWPAIDRTGTIYFVSDEHNGEYNLYRLTAGGKERLTSFPTSIKHPSVSANGEKVVFTRDYRLWVFDTALAEASLAEVRLAGNSTLSQMQDFSVSGNISGFDVSPDKKKLAFVSRGELFVSDADGRFIRRLDTAKEGRVMEVKWQADNKTLLFTQTWNGYQNLYRIAADGSAAEEQLTEDMQNNRSLSLNGDRTKGVYLSGRGEVRLLDVETGDSETVVEDEIWDIRASAPSFSPDDRFILYTAYRDFEQSLFLYDTEEERVIQITDTFVSETSPVWSPDGRYIYFQTNRTEPSFPYGMRDADIYRIALDRIEPEFRSDRISKLFEEDGEESEKDSVVTVTIREEGLDDRWEQVGQSFGTQSSPFVTLDGEKTVVLYRSNHDEGRTAWWKTTFEPFESPKTEKIGGTESWSGSIVEAGGSHWVLLGGEIHKMNVSAGTVEKIETRHTFRRNLRDEFTQMFEEMWANFEANFYIETFHGTDWEEVREQYRAFLPHVRTRDNLRELKNDMLGEVNSSHVGFSSSGDEEDVYYGTMTQATGILFEPDDPYVVKRIVRQSPAWHHAETIEPGDRLVRVNGTDVDPNVNRESYFSAPSGDEEITLAFDRGRNSYEIKVEPASYFSIRNLLYDEWIDERQKLVDEASDERIAYVHMKNMGGGELQHFKEEMVSEGKRRDALILDLRYNTGGNVHDEVLRFLSQRPYLYWGYREGELATQSNFTPAAKPIVMLINQQSLSDAEMTAAGFRELGLGTLIGMETYRWIIFTSGRSLVDGSFYRLPSWGVYTLTGENLERTGVAPDIRINNSFSDRMSADDPQLNRAIQYIMEQLGEE